MRWDLSKDTVLKKENLPNRYCKLMSFKRRFFLKNNIKFFKFYFIFKFYSFFKFYFFKSLKLYNYSISIVKQNYFFKVKKNFKNFYGLNFFFFKDQLSKKDFFLKNIFKLNLLNQNIYFYFFYKNFFFLNEYCSFINILMLEGENSPEIF